MKITNKKTGEGEFPDGSEIGELGSPRNVIANIPAKNIMNNTKTMSPIINCFQFIDIPLLSNILQLLYTDR
ncbi:MAG: hypothetical protein ACXAEU_26630 [Candidatus Hodarchaeales archaeon]